MLILSRKKDETVVLVKDGQVIAEVTVIRGEAIRLGLEASESIRIFRKEIWERMQGELDEAAADSFENYFAFVDCEMNLVGTESEAIAMAESWLDDERGGPWSDESLNIIYGKVLGGTKVTERIDIDEMTDEQKEELMVPSDCTVYEERKILPH